MVAQIYNPQHSRNLGLSSRTARGRPCLKKSNTGAKEIAQLLGIYHPSMRTQIKILSTPIETTDNPSARKAKPEGSLGLAY